jgi:hypothetical protein
MTMPHILQSILCVEEDTCVYTRIRHMTTATHSAMTTVTHSAKYLNVHFNSKGPMPLTFSEYVPRKRAESNTTVGIVSESSRVMFVIGAYCVCVCVCV